MASALIKVPGLKRGDCVAVIRPSSRLDQKLYEESIEHLRALDLCVVRYDELHRSRAKADSFFSADDAGRSREFDWAMREPGIRAVLAARGGYGIQRTLQFFSTPQELRRIKKQWLPKIVVGYSDFTFAHQWIQNQLGWITFHGPLVGMIPKKSLQGLVRELMSLPSTKCSWSIKSHQVLKKGSLKGRGTISGAQAINGKATMFGAQGPSSEAQGRLVGGNLSLLQTSGWAALPKVPMILAIEDVNEPFYKLDRFLMNLWYAGYAPFIKGILLGSFHKCGLADGRTFGWSRVVETMRCLTRGPIIGPLDFGHGLAKQRLLPLGVRVKLRPSSIDFVDPWIGR